MIEPQRQALIPGFRQVRAAAMGAGALGCSISGAGPTVFAWCEEQRAAAIRDAMVAAFGAHGLASDHWITSIEPRRRSPRRSLMQFHEHTQARRIGATLSEAIARGLAPDGGLYVPELAAAPRQAATLAGACARMAACAHRAGAVLRGRWARCERWLRSPRGLRLSGAADAGADEPSTTVLELFHGPTAAFKDFGARSSPRPGAPAVRRRTAR